MLEKSRTERILQYSFYGVLALSALAGLMLVPVKASGLREVRFLALPALSEIVQNAAAALQGHPNGYARALHGYLVYVFMAGSFLSAGRALLKLIVSAPGASHGVLDRVTGRERFAFYFMIGSLAYSLLWLALGVSGALTPIVAYAAGIIGWLPALIGLNAGGAGRQRGISANFSSFVFRLKSLTASQKIFLGFAGAVMLLLSANAAFYPIGADTLASHGGLPNDYIQQGRMRVNPYHFYSLLTQNTEMLIMESLLLGSDFAAQLLAWGFLAAWLLLIWGFLERHAGSVVSMAVTTAVLAVPVVSRSAFEFKNDSSTCLFIFAHYVCLIEALRRGPGEENESGKWFLLSGLAAGGAIGHKLLALPVAFFSVALLAADALIQRWKKRSQRPHWAPLIAGLVIVSAPWFLRTYWHTGNPTYPFFGNVFGLPREAGDKRLLFPEENFPPSGVERGLWNLRMSRVYFQDLLFGYNVAHPNIADSVAHTNSQRPTWGPSLLFALLAAPCFFLPSARGFRLSFAAAALSYFILLYKSPPIRYHMAVLVFLISTPLAVIWRYVLDRFSDKVHLWIPLGTLAMAALVSNVWISSQTSISFLLSGYAPGNYLRDQKTGDVYWMSHLLNTRTGGGDSVLFAGVMETYPFKRKVFATGPLNQQLLVNLAKQSSTAESLRDELIRLGVDHVVYSEASFNKWARWPPLRKTEVMARISELLSRHMRVRYASPDGSLVWYTLKAPAADDAIRLDERDAEQFPVPFIAEIKRYRAMGDGAEAGRLLGAALRAPMMAVHKQEILKMLEADRVER